MGHVKTSTLKLRVDRTIENLLSYFKVTKKEFSRFVEPKIRRTLLPKEKSDLSGDGPFMAFYDIYERTFYFPLGEIHIKMLDGMPSRDTKDDSCFSKRIINHEVSHYIHSHINLGVHECSRFGKDVLIETVADYVNCILDIRGSNNSPSRKCYEQFGSEFLPKLARMTIQEAIKKGVPHLPYSNDLKGYLKRF
jgi:hypothetical protein